MTLPHSDIQAACNIPYLNEILFINIDNLNETDQLIEVLTGAKDLISSGRIKSLGLQSDQAFQIHKSDTCLLDVFSVLESNRLGQFCTAIRAPFNLLEHRLFLNGSIDFAKANGLMVFCDRALMIHPRTRSGFKTYTLLRSVSSHSDVDLIRPLKLAMNNVIHLEKRAETAGISLPWGRRIAGNSDQLMNLYAWNLALQTKIRPGLVDCLENLRNCRDRRAWANHYEESFEVLIERMALAVEHCAYHEIEAIKQSLHEIGGYDLSLSIEDMISLLLRELNVDVAFSPGSKLSINHDVPARRSEEMKQLFKSIADTSFYFEKSKSRLFPLLNP